MCVFRPSYPLTQKQPRERAGTDFPAANTTINFDLNANSVTQWASAADADGDSIPDPWDEFPNDPTLAIRLFLPYQGQHMVLFDEGWPYNGDFDFNDLVIGHRFELLYDASPLVGARHRTPENIGAQPDRRIRFGH